jgi:DNA ligase 1
MNYMPMLSASLDGVDLNTLRYPLIASPKLDGVRCLIHEGVAYSRNRKEIRNRFVQKWAKKYHNLDGELIVGSATEGLVLNRTQSGVMSFAGEPDFTFHLFDSPEGVTGGFLYRLAHAAAEHHGEPRIKAVEHTTLIGPGELAAFEQKCLDEGYEGVMLRDPYGPYKSGRSTLREGYLMKLKRFVDGEGVVTGVEEAMENRNEATINELGHTQRSSHAENLFGKGMVGALLVRTTGGQDIRVSPGIMNHAERQFYWSMQHLILGKTIHWRAFGYGVKDKPRFPRFYGFREDV